MDGELLKRGKQIKNRIRHCTQGTCYEAAFRKTSRGESSAVSCLGIQCCDLKYCIMNRKSK